jgi:hypothetical protein
MKAEPKVEYLVDWKDLNAVVWTACLKVGLKALTLADKMAESMDKR